MKKATAPDPNDCGGEHAARALSVDEALRFITSDVKPVHGHEMLALRGALGRILAEDVYSPFDVPAHTNSAVDGYAVRSVDLPKGGKIALRVVGTSWAGKPYAGTMGAGECVRIMTGAVIPEGADIVVMQEHVDAKDDAVEFESGYRAGDNVRAAGEDVARGAMLLRAGRQILPAELGLLASVGVAEVRVTRRLRVAFFSTGDELRSIGETLAPGQIYDSNRYTLYGMLTRLGADLIDMGVVRDDRDAVHAAFLEAAAHADAIITSGGVSVGEADFVKETLEALGQVGFWQISMKPGRPLAFGRVREAVFFGLPGNPVSVMVTYYLFVEPALRRMMGQTEIPIRATLKVRSASRFKKRPGRTEYQRAILERGADGELNVRATGDQGSGILRSMSSGNCFVVLPKDSGTVEPGTPVDVQPFQGLV